MPKFYALLLLAIFSCLTLFSQTSSVVINEVYGGGGNSGATIKYDFIELYNKSSNDVDLSGWSVQYASSSGTTWQRTVLTGSIPAGGYYLIRQAAGTGGSNNFPTPNDSGNIAMSATAGKVVLLKTSAQITAGTSCPSLPAYQIVDLVGFGTTTNCFEGAGPTATLSNTVSASRSSSAADTDNNNADFTTGAPSPTNSPRRKTIAISNSADASEPSVNGSITLTFSQATVSPVTFSYTMGGSAILETDFHATLNNGATASSLAFAEGVITVPAGVTSVVITITPIDDLTNEGKETIAFSISDPDQNYTTGTANISINLNDDDVGVSKIHVIQGSGAAATPGTYAIEGIVTAVYPNWSPAGYFVQEEDADKDDDLNTSEGIFVVQANPTVTIGDKVRVTGAVQENNSSPSFNQAVLIQSSFARVSQENALPDYTIFSLPVTTQTELEKYEGMLVQYDGTLTVTDNSEVGNRGSLQLSAGGLIYQPTQIIDPNDADPSGTSSSGAGNVAAVNAYHLSNVNRSIILDDGSNITQATLVYVNSDNTNRVGSTTENLKGVMAYGFSAYRLQPLSYAAPEFTFATRPALPALQGNLKIISFNVLNYFNGDGTGGGFPTSRGANSLVEFNRQRAKVISALAELNADIVGLLEIENDGTGPASAIQDLVNGLNAILGEGTYAIIQDGVTSQLNNTDQIRAGIIYKPSVVIPVGGVFTSDNAVFERPPLAQTFKLNNIQKTFTYIINHFKSKGSCPGGSSPNPDRDAGDGQSCWNERRKQQAEALVQLINTVIVPFTGNDRVISMGDYNAYFEEDPMDVFRSHGLIVLGSASSSSYLFGGQLGSLDHAVVTNSMNALLSGFTKWNINSVEPSYLDYNDGIRDAGESTTDVNPWSSTYTPTPWRSSDHDAVITAFTFFKTTDITITKQASPSVNTGSVIDYQIKVNNNGPDVAENVVLSDTIPQGATFVSATAPPGWTITAPNPGAQGTLTATIAALPAGVEQQFTLSIKVPCLFTATTINNEATVTTVTPDPDNSNNTASASTNVVVSTPLVTIADAKAMITGVLPNTVYPGYLPASTIGLTAMVTGGQAPYLYNWSDGTATPGIAVSPATNTVYTITVSDANGCTGTASKEIKVIDVRAGKNLDKVAICHKNSNTLEIASVDVTDHLMHGDMLGACGELITGRRNNPVSSERLVLSTYPNPSRTFFTIQLPYNDHPYSLIVKDVTGKVIERRSGLASRQTFQVGHGYLKGIYFVELVSGEERSVLKLVKN